MDPSGRLHKGNRKTVRRAGNVEPVNPLPSWENTRVARPNRQVERRSEILDATIALIERNDVANLRIADVAAELGLTANAVRYYFKDMAELLSELALRSDARFYDDRHRVIDRTAEPAAQLALTIAAGLPTGPEDAEWRAIWRAVLRRT